MQNRFFHSLLDHSGSLVNRIERFPAESCFQFKYLVQNAIVTFSAHKSSLQKVLHLKDSKSKKR